MIDMVTKVLAKREGMPISLKHTHEIMEAVKGKQISKANELLKKVLLKEAYIPFRKYPSKGHKHGVSAGFPQKATKQVISILEELRSNIKNMGFDESKVVISGYLLGRGGYPRFSSGAIYRHGKRTNLAVYSLIDQERKATVKKEPVKEKKETAKEEVNPAAEKEKNEEPVKEEKEVKSETGEKPEKKNKNTENSELKAET